MEGREKGGTANISISICGMSGLNVVQNVTCEVCAHDISVGTSLAVYCTYVCTIYSSVFVCTIYSSVFVCTMCISLARVSGRF